MHHRICKPAYKRSGIHNARKMVTSSHRLLAVVLPQGDELEDIRVLGLEVDRDRARSLVATLVNISRSRVVYAEHRHNAIRVTIRSGNVGSIENLARRRNETKIKRTQLHECYGC